MKKLLGAYIQDGRKYIILQENGKVVALEGNASEFKNSELLKNRNEYVKNVLEKEEIYGDDVFDFRYGPVTSGVGEAGVYHLYTYGERILSVKIDTSYKRRALDDKMISSDINDALKLSEEICGNFAISHSIAFSRAVENALKIEVSRDIKALKAIAIELERIYNHLYVISRLAGAAAQQVLASHLMGLFEDSLVVNKIFSGSRYLIRFNSIGSVLRFPSHEELKDVTDKVKKIKSAFSELYKNSMSSGNYIDRLHLTATLSAKDAELIGLTGPSLRACGVKEDLRTHDEIYRGIKIVSDEEGDALSRMEVRAGEILESLKFIQKTVDNLSLDKAMPFISTESGEGIGWSESPSGTIIYHVEIENFRIKSVYVSTPSVFGMSAIAHSMVGNIFTDFPFAVESFGVNFSDAAR